VPFICFLRHLLLAPLPAPWWQVNFEEDVAVQKVIIYNRRDCPDCEKRLSYAAVSLLDANNKTIGVYHLPDMNNVLSKTILISEFGLNHDVRKVKVQILKRPGITEHLNFAEVEVYDKSGNNKALNSEHTSQSSTWSDGGTKMDSTKAVDGNRENLCATNAEVGK
jgi:glutaredoxin